ncbi:MAG: hypothetical protein AUF79_07455 [Crenarchaeota archaeon 13_1_20CM_2_51_8]|nr:MAG: hypothetical protein AUF79_07455 [Crenarchaeota archaeon 13_1_20CM_2_51_8]
MLILGIIGQNTPTNCPPNGCPPDVLWRIYGPSIISFYSGIALIAVGIILLFVARRMKPEKDTNRESASNTSNNTPHPPTAFLCQTDSTGRTLAFLNLSSTL